MSEVYVDERACPQNHPCPTVRTCPTGAIYQENPFSAPKINKKKCTNCGLCLGTCLAFQNRN